MTHLALLCGMWTRTAGFPGVGIGGCCEEDWALNSKACPTALGCWLFRTWMYEVVPQKLGLKFGTRLVQGFKDREIGPWDAKHMLPTFRGC